MKAATVAANANTRKHRNRQHQRTSSADVDPTDAGSLTYSTTSSINSTGESTDSSFADIMKVLEMQDPSELSSLPIQERGMTPAEYQAVKAQNPSFSSLDPLYLSHHPSIIARMVSPIFWLEWISFLPDQGKCMCSILVLNCKNDERRLFFATLPCTFTLRSFEKSM